MWMYLARYSKGRASNRAALEAYVSSDAFMTNLAKLDPTRRLLALQGVRVAFDRLESPVPAAPAPRVWWTEARKAQLREAAARLPTDRALARELGVPITKAKAKRWLLLGAKRSTAHITKAGPRQLTA